MEDMPIEYEWLSQILGEGTRKHYTRAITYFKEFLKTSSAEDLINFRKRERNFETRIIQFFQWLQKERGITSNSARAYVIGLQSQSTEENTLKMNDLTGLEVSSISLFKPV